VKDPLPLPELTKLLETFPSLAGTPVALLHQGGDSTIDHFLRGPLESAGASLTEFDTALPPIPASLQRIGECDLIVAVRYLPRSWLRPLARMRAGGARLILLLDDDLLDPDAMRPLPRDYRRRLWQRIGRLGPRLPDLVDQIWVTSELLAHKYAHLGTKQLPLHPHPDLLSERPRLQLAYLGTSVHEAEFAWLLPLLEQLQRRYCHTHVELFGDLELNRRFRQLPRVRILHPMRWNNFLAETSAGRIDILLTPLLASTFNAARAPVKVIDAARSGAAGLFSNRPPYRGFVRDGIDGLLLDDDPANWLAAIDRLIAEPLERLRLAEAARRRALALSRGEQE
jgi:glycosyltransferase involved in cell wall biosynthesis